MNGKLQGAIDYWVNVGVQKTIREKWTFELRLNHFCRHETVRDASYIWNLNEVLGRVGMAGRNFDLALGVGGFTGGSEGYRQLAVISVEWRGVFIPELALAAELKWVNFTRFFHEWGLSLSLNKNIDLFFKNVRHYEFPNASYLGLRYKSAPDREAVLDSMKVRVGASPFDDVFKLEVAGNFKFEFFSNPSRRVVAGVDFESPILNGDGFFAQFWPGKMIYDISLDYEKKIGPKFFAAWTSHYRLDMPVDDDLPFAASLFTGLALRNQPNFDELAQTIRYEVAAGYDFKRGLEGCVKLGVLFCQNDFMKLLAEVQTRADAKRIKGDFRVLANFGRVVQLRPYIGWKKDFFLDDAPSIDGKLLFGLGFFKKF
ncbi:MAG: hypothetical protein IH584_06975 [Candidatus Aminicenantes bacterium]|nr:hypothetical protein [Candidatus Aminicenantes bacterium]